MKNKGYFKIGHHKFSNAHKFVKGNITKTIFKLGRTPWNKGKKLSEEHRENIKKANKNNSHEGSFKRGHMPWNKNGQHTEKTKEKMSISRIGSKHWNWKGGITPLNNLIRQCFQYRQWRSDIFTKNNFTCQECGQKGGNLEADHYPKSFSDIIKEYNIKDFGEAITCEELWNINNGRTLCMKCHNKTKTGNPNHLK